MAKRTWTLNLEGNKHIIELDHGYFSGKREVRVDGKLIEQSKKVFDTGSDHAFRLDGHSCVIHIQTNGITVNYDLSVDWHSVESGKPVMISQLSPNSPDNPEIGDLQRRMKLENRFKAGGNWFFWIAG